MVPMEGVRGRLWFPWSWGRLGVPEHQTVVDPKRGKVDALSSRTWDEDAQAGTQLHSSTWV